MARQRPAQLANRICAEYLNNIYVPSVNNSTLHPISLFRLFYKTSTTTEAVICRGQNCNSDMQYAHSWKKQESEIKFCLFPCLRGRY